MKPEILRAKNIFKSAAGTPVLEGVNFSIFGGEMVAVIGLQYSGKSMLAAVLSGAEKPDSGTILVDDEPMRFSSIADAQRAGIYCVSREPQLINSMTIAENFYVVSGANSGRGVFSAKRHVEAARKVLEEFGLPFDPNAKVSGFARVERRMIEFVKIALQNPRLIITDGDADFDIRDAWAMQTLMKKVLGMGISILAIGNKLDDVIFECDRVYPLRDGIFGKCILREDYSHERLFLALTGQELPKRGEEPGPGHPDIKSPVVLETVGLDTGDGRKLSFRLRAGETAAVVTPDSVRAHDLAWTLFGEKKLAGGWMLVDGHAVEPRSASDAIGLGLVLVSAAVEASGAFRTLSVTENITLMALAREHGSFGVPPARMSRYMAKSIEEHYGIECSGDETMLARAGLRRSDWYKLTIARWMPMRPKVYIFLNPFADTDEKNSQELEQILRELAAGGAGVLIISAGPYRLRNLCDSFLFLE